MKILRNLAKAIALPLALLVTLAGCSLSPIYEDSPEPGVTYAPIPPYVEGPAGSSEVTLFFRYQDEQLLTTQTVTLNGAYTDKRKLVEAAVTSLIEGPGEESRYDKHPVLPPTTRVENIQGEENLCTITLSRDILTRMVDGRTISAATDQVLVSEAERARRLGIQALVATVVHTGAYSDVQVLVADASGGQGARVARKSLGFYNNPDELLGPLSSDMSVVLNPALTLQIVFDCLADRNGERLYKFVAQRDGRGEARPSLQTVLTLLEQTATLRGVPQLHTGELLITGSGQRAIFPITVSFLQRDGSVLDMDRYPMIMLREDEVWKVDFSSLSNLVPGL